MSNNTQEKGREIKFREWVEADKQMFGPWTIDQIASGEYVTKFTGILMQFIGLYDRNGVEIYEGDILDNGAGTVACEVIYSYGDCGFILRTLSKKVHYGNPHTFENRRIIGNLYQHPELLK